MERVFHVATGADVGVRERTNCPPQPSCSAPLRIPLQQADDLREIEQPEELRLLESLRDYVTVDHAKVQKRASHGRARYVLNDGDLVLLEPRAADPNVAVVARAGARRDLGPARVGTQAV